MRCGLLRLPKSDRFHAANVNNMMELRSDTANIRNVTGPRNGRTLPRAAEMRRHLLGPLERRVKRPRPRQWITQYGDRIEYLAPSQRSRSRMTAIGSAAGRFCFASVLCRLPGVKPACSGTCPQRYTKRCRLGWGGGFEIRF
jgi:hypothetical protein